MPKPILMLCLLGTIPLQAQDRYGVVISEFMADPTPPVRLPQAEWIELRNTGPGPVQLLNWRIGDDQGSSGAFPALQLQPDSSVIICSSGNAAVLAPYGRVLPVSGFPTLDNEGDLLWVRNASGRVMHAVSYSIRWYAHDWKKDGGWSLEMIDPLNPCGGSGNWSASTDPAGGTPGRRNATDARRSDTDGPRPLHAYTTDPFSIILCFNEPVDSTSGATTQHYAADGLQWTSAQTLPPLFDRVRLRSTVPLLTGKIYTLTVTGVRDCRGNEMAEALNIRTGLPATPGPGDWIINEVLFNPRSNAFDFVEFLNRSDKILDASELFLAGRNGSGILQSPIALHPTPRYLFPGELCVVTEDAASLRQEYPIAETDRIFEVGELPSLPDDAGTVVTFNARGSITDELRYLDDWHFPLLSDPEGVSLERIDPAGPTQDRNNWHSAASTTGFGTPGRRNSQYREAGISNGMMTLSSRLFSPDQDGRDDILQLHYRTDGPGWIGIVRIHDVAGRVVRRLVRNDLMGVSGTWTWDGTDDTGRALGAGLYVVDSQWFRTDGRKQQQLLPVILARRFN